MATAANSDIRRLYSWWWDSHISRKNSKWLEENLKDMDMKVSMMIRLLEEDGDSFAKKAEMYFQKRPELLKLVEEFYRAYRALAERYDHATVALRQAHRTIQEAFPNQIPSTPTEASSDDLQKEVYDVDAPNIVSIKSNGKARKVLNFLEEDGKGYDKADLNYKIEGENGEAISLECQKLSEKISNLELEISRAQEENEKINSELERCLIFEQKVNVLTKQMNERGEEIETLKHRSEEADLKNCSLIEDLHKVEEQNENLSKELRSNQEELEEERILKVKAEEALKSSEKLNLSHQRELKVLFSDLQMKSENLSDLEDKVKKLEVENQSLTAQLQQKIMVSQGESSNLELKLKCIVDQILGIGLSEESFQFWRDHFSKLLKLSHFNFGLQFILDCIVVYISSISSPHPASKKISSIRFISFK